MEQLNNLESTLLKGLIEKYPSLESHIPYLKVKDPTTQLLFHNFHFKKPNIFKIPRN